MITSIGFVLLLLSFVFDTDEESIIEWILDITATAGIMVMAIGVTIFLWRTMP